jgi:deoxyribonuclease V
MNISQRHPWSLTEEEAITVQEELKSEVITEDKFNTPVKYVAGVDMAVEEDGKICRAAVAVLSFSDLEVKETSIAYSHMNFPYIPGLLSFREVPAVLEALKKLTIAPDIILCDGQGIAHPRRFGFACHLGILVDIPTIGVAKSWFIGEYGELGTKRGSWEPLVDKGEIIGALLRSQSNVKPIYVSIGHRISLPTAIDYVLKCAPKYRLPETTRLSDRLSRGNL